MKWVERFCFAAVLLMLVLGIVILLGAVTGVIPSTSWDPCRHEVGGTGKTSGSIHRYSGTLTDQDGDRVVCVGGDQR